MRPLPRSVPAGRNCPAAFGSRPCPAARTPLPERWSSRQYRCQAESGADQPDASGQEDADSPQPTLDWRRFRANLVATERREKEGSAEQLGGADPSTRDQGEAAASDGDVWAHQISAPETGCLLLAKPTGDMGFFNDSVILLLQHDNATGSLGLLLGRELKNRPQGPFAQVISMVAGMYVGGPVGLDKILILHGPPAMEDSIELLEGIFVGGWRGAQERVTGGKEEAASESLPELSVYSGSCGWTRWQLEAEERTGAWWVVSASPKCMQQLLKGVHSERDIRAKIFELTGIPENLSKG